MEGWIRLIEAEAREHFVDEAIRYWAENSGAERAIVKRSPVEGSSRCEFLQDLRNPELTDAQGHSTGSDSKVLC